MLPKIATDMAVMIMVFMLLPSHTIKIGAIADFGRLFKITKYGSKISLNVVFHQRSMATRKMCIRDRVRIHRVLVDDKGEIQQTFESKDLEEEYPVDYETLITMGSVYKLSGKTYNLYSGQVKDSNGDAVDNEMGYDSSSGRYSKVIQPIGEAEKLSLIHI